MRFRSTRKQSPEVDLSLALTQGLAPDGGLYVPCDFPSVTLANFKGSDDPATFAIKLLTPFLKHSALERHTQDICRKAFNFPLPLKRLNATTSMLELFHGPTLAFKDVGARFLAASMSKLQSRSTVIVATSGDTGGAVAAAFSEYEDTITLILYPKGKISRRQEIQLTCWGDRVHAFAINSDFDRCQKLVKDALGSSSLQARHRFISANSISLGRLLPQMVYHARASLQYFEETGIAPDLIIPSGNLGNSVAALWAKRVGFPIRRVILATNANSTLADFFQSGVYQPHTTIATLANAMDVGNPSNIERLRDLYPTMAQLRNDVAVNLVTDDEIRKTIRSSPQVFGEIVCPHTATALQSITPGEHAIVEATAHPSKFETIVEPLIGKAVPVPQALLALESRPTRSIDVPSPDTFLNDLAQWI